MKSLHILDSLHLNRYRMRCLSLHFFKINDFQLHFWDCQWLSRIFLVQSYSWIIRQVLLFLRYLFFSSCKIYLSPWNLQYIVWLFQCCWGWPYQWITIYRTWCHRDCRWLLFLCHRIESRDWRILCIWSIVKGRWRRLLRLSHWRRERSKLRGGDRFFVRWSWERQLWSWWR